MNSTFPFFGLFLLFFSFSILADEFPALEDEVPAPIHTIKKVNARKKGVTRAVEIGFKTKETVSQEGNTTIREHQNTLLNETGIIRLGEISSKETGFPNQIPTLHVFDGTKKVDLFAAKLPAVSTPELAEENCAKLDPKGKWRLPVKEDLDSLILISSAKKEYEEFLNFVPLPDTANRDLQVPLFLLWVQKSGNLAKAEPSSKTTKEKETNAVLASFDTLNLQPKLLAELQKSNASKLDSLSNIDIKKAHEQRIQYEKAGLENWEKWFSDLLKDNNVKPDSDDAKKARAHYEKLHHIQEGKDLLKLLEARGADVLNQTKQMVEKQKNHEETVKKFLNPGIPVVCFYGLASPKTIDPTVTSP